MQLSVQKMFSQRDLTCSSEWSIINVRHMPHTATKEER